jgi:hypothetical protein
MIPFADIVKIVQESLNQEPLLTRTIREIDEVFANVKDVSYCPIRPEIRSHSKMSKNPRQVR